MSDLQISPEFVGGVGKEGIVDEDTRKYLLDFLCSNLSIGIFTLVLMRAAPRSGYRQWIFGKDKYGGGGFREDYTDLEYSTGDNLFDECDSMRGIPVEDYESLDDLLGRGKSHQEKAFVRTFGSGL
ncbi:MAG: hypothetical protein DRN71_00470 [Candidatus Nanohalarchaeota archaeon]|nr:MAG: hypothetical protein DRN71_00470 [Candidatus Nanohaloarchaeota archaeon]